MEIKEFQNHLIVGVIIFVIIFLVIFCFVLYLGYEEVNKKESLYDNEIEDIKNKWMNWFQIKKENFDDQEEETNTEDKHEPENFEEEKETEEKETEEKPEPENFEEETEETEEEIPEKKKKKKKYKLKEGMNPISKAFNKIGKSITNAFKKIGKDIVNKIIKPMTNFFGKITKPILAVFKYISCGFNKIKNIFVCFKWYLLEMIGKIYYFPIHLICEFMKITDIEDEIWKMIYTADYYFHEYTDYHFAHYPDDVIKLCYKC